MFGSILEVRHLRLVRAIAEEGGPTRAAARLRITQSAVSHQLSELEERLGVVLFTRVKRQLKLTPAGARLVEASRTMLAQLAQAEREIHQASAQRRETLRLAVESFTAYHWLPPIMSALEVEHPHVDVRIVLEASRDPVAALRKGTLDLALVSTFVKESALRSTLLFDDEWAVLLPPKHPLAARPYLSALELSSETLITHSAPRSDTERFREHFAREGASLPRIMTVPLTDVLLEVVKAGLGLGLVSRWAIYPSEQRGEVASRRFTCEGLSEQWFAVYRRDACPRLPLPRVVELMSAEHYKQSKAP